MRNYPLNATRAFEAAARLQNLSEAATELSVSPGAISHQLKKLEDFLGVKLFERRARGIALTDAGQELSEDLTRGFSYLDQAMHKALSGKNDTVLKLSVAPVFAVKWLLPKIQDFYSSYPEIEVLVSTGLDIVDLQAGVFDAAIRFSAQPDADLVSVELFKERVTPMLSPKLELDISEIKTPDDLSKAVLLHNVSTDRDTSLPSWSDWLDSIGCNSVDPSKGQRFGQPDHAMQAAIDGGGVVLGWVKMAETDLSSGRLLMPFKKSLPMERSFWFVSTHRTAETRRVKLFRSWLKSRLTD